MSATPILRLLSGTRPFPPWSSRPGLPSSACCRAGLVQSTGQAWYIPHYVYTDQSGALQESVGVHPPKHKGFPAIPHCSPEYGFQRPGAGSPEAPSPTGDPSSWPSVSLITGHASPRLLLQEVSSAEPGTVCSDEAKSEPGCSWRNCNRKDGRPEAKLPALCIKRQWNLPAPRPSTSCPRMYQAKPTLASSQLQADLADATFQKPVLAVPLFSPPNPCQ